MKVKLNCARTPGSPFTETAIAGMPGFPAGALMGDRFAFFYLWGLYSGHEPSIYISDFGIVLPLLFE
jgi:hypothetical protein